MKTGPVTQQDIAEKLNVTRITVSKALRNHPDISADMKLRVQQAVEEMGYSPNLVARQLTLRKTFTIGVVIPDLENSFFAYITDSIIDAATEQNYHVIVTVSRENAEIERQNIQNLIGMRVDGLLVCISQFTTDTTIFEFVKKLNTPLVFFDRAIENIGFQSVIFDDETGSADAIRQLVSAGFSKIAHFAGYSSLDIGRKRCEGYKEALEKNSLTFNEDWIIEGGYEIEDGYKAFEKLLSSGQLPQIIFAVNDRVALGAYKAIRKAGLLIPDDIGVIGFGFNDTAQNLSPSLAIINQNPREMGKKAVNMLVDEIKGDKITESSQVLLAEDFQWNNSIK